MTPSQMTLNKILTELVKKVLDNKGTLDFRVHMDRKELSAIEIREMAVRNQALNKTAIATAEKAIREQERERVEKLKGFAGHKSGCAHYQHKNLLHQTKDYGCDCGLVAALAEMEE